MSWTPPPSRVASLVLAALLSAAAHARHAQESTTPPTTTRVAILDHAALTRALEDIASGSGGVASIVPVGVSRAGRRIDALRLARGEASPGRPAILVVACLDGELAWTSGLVVDHARELLARSADDEDLRELLETTTLYLVPRANPDAAEHRTRTPLAEVSATGPGGDDDRDGRNGEDGPADVDGDGVVGWMRVLDPEGEWIEDPADPRAMIRADRAKGQRGRWKLQREARDADRDEKAGEDGANDVVVNRNFPQGWQEHAPEAGRYATEEPEASALADFLLLHKDVALVLAYGTLDNLAEKPKVKEDGGRRSTNPSDGIPAADADLLAELGRRWKKLGGTNGRTDGRDAGTFQAWAQAQRGLWTVNVAPWSVPLDEKAPEKPGAKPASPPDAPVPGKGADARAPDAQDTAAPVLGAQVAQDGQAPKDAKGTKDGQDAPRTDDAPKPSDDAKRLRWFDAHPEVRGFRPWTAFRHPELGDVELGGFAPYALVEPPAEERARIADTTLAFLATLGEALPRVRVAEAKATSLGADTWRIEAAIANEGLLPLQSGLARRARSLRPARASLALADGASLVAGPREELVSELAGSGGRRDISWIVRARSLDAIAVVVDTDSAGTARVTPEEKR